MTRSFRARRSMARSFRARAPIVRSFRAHRSTARSFRARTLAECAASGRVAPIAQLQGASLQRASLQATDLSGAYLWRTNHWAPPEVPQPAAVKLSDFGRMMVTGLGGSRGRHHPSMERRSIRELAPHDRIPSLSGSAANSEPRLRACFMRSHSTTATRSGGLAKPT